MNAWRLSALFFLLIVDVNLNAEAIFFPKKCWGKDGANCAVQNDSRSPLSLHLKGVSIHMDAQAIVKDVSTEAAALTRGTLFASHEEEFRWRSPFGEVICQTCEVLLQRGERSLEVHAIKGNVTIIRKGDGGKYTLPPGFSVELSAVTSNGQSNLGFPQASPLLVVGKAWAKLHSEDAHEFKKEFEEYVETWQDAADLSSDMQKKEADRMLASDQAEQHRLELLRQSRLKEQERLRNIFKEKNYIQ